MVILRTRNKITDFWMILAWAIPFNLQKNFYLLVTLTTDIVLKQYYVQGLHLNLPYSGNQKFNYSSTEDLSGINSCYVLLPSQCLHIVVSYINYYIIAVFSSS